MKKTRLFGIIGAGFIAATMALGATTTTVAAPRGETISENKATLPDKVRSRHQINNTIGGMPLVTIHPNYGMCPKEYGLRYGHGNKGGRSNRLRLSHKAKLKRRTGNR